MQCRICGSTGEHTVYTAKEMMLGLRDEHRYFQCVDCGCLQIEAIPDNLAAYYPSNYYSYSVPNAASKLKKQLLRQRDYYAVTGKSLLGHVLSLASPNSKLSTLRPIQLKQDSRILDVGCGAGLLLNSLREAGFTQLLGIDPFNADTIHYPNGLVIEKRDIFSETGEWDLIMFHHSFEHLVEQQKTLVQAQKLLAKHGTVLLRVPTVSSYAWQHYGVNWSQLDAPRHLFLHSVDSIKKLAEQTGFTVSQVQYDSNAFQFWGSEQYEQDIALRSERSWAENPANSPFTDEQIKQFEHRARELNALNKGDQAAFYLRKAS
ncbi:class I SAM-dependent methyltransferase [uncultured Thiothrix sp.]|uniref:class I SAM-dependent methyltransferase n=1 Tax=uncultured Thiothrix sp. TaxID=223185 RepID=UPI00262508D6|nr:class I SAM-dependent methyltransferase [uncultured Thiothrix sp.]